MGSVTNRVGQTLKLFVTLRLAELGFFLSFFALVGLVDLAFKNGLAVAANEVSKAEWGIGLTVVFVYYIGLWYLPIALVTFVILAVTVTMNARRLALINSMTYLLHSLPFMWIFALRPASPELWIVWLSIIAFNYSLPYGLLRLKWFSFFAKADFIVADDSANSDSEGP